MPVLAILFVFGAHETSRIFPGSFAPLVFDAFVFALFGAFAIHRFGLLSATPPDATGESMTVR